MLKQSLLSKAISSIQKTNEIVVIVAANFSRSNIEEWVSLVSFVNNYLALRIL